MLSLRNEQKTFQSPGLIKSSPESVITAYEVNLSNQIVGTSMFEYSTHSKVKQTLKKNVNHAGLPMCWISFIRAESVDLTTMGEMTVEYGC